MTTTISNPQSETSRISRKHITAWILRNVVWIWLIALVAIFAGLNQYFFTILNLQNILVQATVLGMMALAMSPPLLVAEIDLSVPANVGFSAAVSVTAHTALGVPFAWVPIIGIGVATLIGFFNAICITKLKMVSLIETLAMMIILEGGLLALTQGRTITGLSDGYMWLGQATIGDWPVMPLIFLLAILGMYVILRHTVLGRSIFAVGGNPVASNAAGIRVDRIKIASFTLSGFLAGVAGYLLASWQAAITSNQGSSYLLYAIAAPIIGGVSVFGGRGSVIGVLGGVLLLTVIQVGLAIVSVPSFYVGMIGGFMIFIAVAIDAIRVRYFG